MKTDTVYKRALNATLELLRSGEFASGLPSENQLRALIGVSRTTVREALRSLAAAGLIFKVPGASGGSFVQGIDYRSLGGVLGESIVNTLRLGTLEYDEVSQVRRLLEVPAAALAAENRTEEDIEQLRRARIVERNVHAIRLCRGFPDIA
jgi:GntR family transcriptional regulator, transcriptional repressor for pyruvate dehydrogenase complex